jgi:hypothetical protein
MSETTYRALQAGIRQVIGGKGIDPAHVIEILQEIRESTGSIICKQHPLGFAHIELTTAAQTDFRTRLHIWTEDTARWADKVGALHDHTWELRSAVLIGEVTDEYLTPREETHGTYKAFRINYAEDGNKSEPLAGLWDLDQRGRRTIRAGEAYSLPPRVVHVSTVRVFPTATLVAAVERGGLGPTVYAPLQEADIPAASRPSLSAAWIEDTLTALSSTLM